MQVTDIQVDFRADGAGMTRVVGSFREAPLLLCGGGTVPMLATEQKQRNNGNRRRERRRHNPRSSLLPPVAPLSGASAPLEKRMESSCRRGGGLRSGEQQDGVSARILEADTE